MKCLCKCYVRSFLPVIYAYYLSLSIAFLNDPVATEACTHAVIYVHMYVYIKFVVIIVM